MAAHFGPLAARKRVLYQRRLRRIGPPTGERRLCDLGCGDGQFLELARDHGWDVSGIEMNPAAAKRAEERGAVVYEGLVEETSDVPAGTFDLVTAWDSVEHTPDPVAFLQAARSLLRPGGLLALTTLNVNSAVARLYRDGWSMYVEDHFTYWSRQSLAATLGTAGFSVTEQWGAGIGRDFAKLANHLPRRRSSSAEVDSSSSSQSGFDSDPRLTLVEEGINRALGALRLGVEVGALARRET